MKDQVKTFSALREGIKGSHGGGEFNYDIVDTL
jgi:hypothetical protein